jgi:DNA-binding HxlR family transcriptional regulator
MRSYRQYCGLALALDLVGDRWTLLIVRELLTGAKRFRDLQDGLPGVATNLLSSRLRMLEESELIERRTLPPPAGTTVYSLTNLGAELEEPVHALVRWGAQFMGHRTREQEFRSHWLGVALQAVGLHADSSPESLALQTDLPEGSLMLNLSPSGVEVGTLDARVPDVRLRGTAACILGLAAGELDWNAAVRSGLEVEGSKTAVAVLRASLNKTGSAKGLTRRAPTCGKE